MRHDTVEALRERHTGSGLSVRQFAAGLGLSFGLVSDVLHARHGHVSRQAENRVREALGLIPRRRKRTAAIRISVELRDLLNLERKRRGLTWNAYIRQATECQSAEE